jgi:hypothetical protein
MRERASSHRIFRALSCMRVNGQVPLPLLYQHVMPSL